MTLPRVLGLLFAVALTFRLASAVGLIASDDLGYSMFAEAIRDGVFEPTAHHYAFRYAVTLAVAAVYSVCGISEWSMVAVPLLCSTLSVVLLWSIANRLYGVKVAWVAAGLLATFPLSLHYASILVPEPVAVCYSLLGVWLCLRAMSDRSFAMAAVAGFVFGAGVLAKEPVAFLGLAFGGSAVVNRNWRVVGGLALGVAIVAGGEMTYHLLVNGDPLLRIHSLKLHEASPMAIAANEHLSYRVFRAYPRMMIVPSLDFGVHSVLALGAGALAWWCWSGRYRMLLALWTILPWAYINFGSSSFDHYFVLPLGSRYLEFTYPPLFILTALTGVKVAERFRWSTRPLLAAFVAVAVTGVVCGIANRENEPRSNLVKELRAVASEAHHRGVKVATIIQTPEPATSQVTNRWRRAFAILAHDIELIDDPTRADVVISVNESTLSVEWR